MDGQQEEEGNGGEYEALSQAESQESRGEPATLAQSLEGPEGRYTVQWHTLAGRLPCDATIQQKPNEDAFSVDALAGLFGVYDGNGKGKQLLLDMLEITEEEWPKVAHQQGLTYNISTQLDPDEASLLLSQRLPNVFAHLNGTESGASLERTLRRLVKNEHTKVRDYCLIGTGSTAVVIKVSPNVDKIISVNVGDSRAVLYRNGVAFQLSQDHPADKNIGSLEFDEKCIYVREEAIDPSVDQFLVLMSDGVYNAFVGGNDEIVHFLKQHLPYGRSDCQNTAMLLVEEARRLEEARTSVYSKIDDMTALVVLFHPKPNCVAKQLEVKYSGLQPGTQVKFVLGAIVCAAALGLVVVYVLLR